MCLTRADWSSSRCQNQSEKGEDIGLGILGKCDMLERLKSVCGKQHGAMILPDEIYQIFLSCIKIQKGIRNNLSLKKNIHNYRSLTMGIKNISQ